MIGEIKPARRAAGWSQTTLADRVGVDAQTTKRLEKGVGEAWRRHYNTIRPHGSPGYRSPAPEAAETTMR